MSKQHPWIQFEGLGPRQRQSMLTFPEVNAVKVSLAAGFSKASIARMLDVSQNVIQNALKPSYRPKES